MGNMKKLGVALTPPSPPRFPLRSLLTSLRPNLWSQTLLCDHKVCKHMLLCSGGPPHGFFTAVLMLKTATQKNNEHLQTHTLLAQSWSCVTCIPLQFTLAWLCVEGGGDEGSFQVNGIQINWQDLRGSEIILRHCNGVGLSRTLIRLGLRDNCLLLEQNTIRVMIKSSRFTWWVYLSR